MRKVWLVTCLCVLAVAVLAAASDGATPAGGPVSPAATTTSWQGGPFLVPNPTGVCADAVTPGCDNYSLTITAPPTGAYTVDISTNPSSADDDYDLYVYAPDGRKVGSSASASGREQVTLDSPAAGTYTVQVVAFMVNPGDTYTGTATMTVAPPPVTPDPSSVQWAWDASKPQESVTVPLRVVMVGFKPGEVDESKVLGEIPNYQQPGVLIPRGQANNPDNADFPFGADTLVNHGRSYYDSVKPFLVPYEYRWQPQVIYAPDAFTTGLFGAMMQNSSTGDFSDSRARTYLEKYNADRGVYRGAANLVTPNAPVRFVNGEPVEDWIAANSQALLGWSSGPKGGKRTSPGTPGYTVYILNTWDSPQALAALRPQHEYHVFKIDRTDPDTNLFAGIDWARVWGGNYRFMMVDTGAGPNPYESESWANRRRSALGSAAYDPPLWEYRANAPRPVTAVHLANGWTQAVTPGSTWDKNQLGLDLGRTVQEAVGFRFEHSYLYEPWPSTGQYFMSNNVWHDKFAEVPWPTDLTKLFNQQAVLSGLSTLVPYFSFAGDTKYEYLNQGGADFDADQAMLQQAKQNGDDVAGAPFVSMKTLTGMDYLDAHASRFERGGACYTTIPTINVVAEKHYAWALPIAAGIATNRDGVPWGVMNSVNDVFKYSGADKDPMLMAVHPPTATGSFTYTAIHEASHFLGLAHPHDTIGASRNADGSPHYWDGFTWTFDSTKAPTTYAHDELTYGVLDQENIARGHSAYYLKWANEALADGGTAYSQKGLNTVGQLPAADQKLRKSAISSMATARQRFAAFDFINAAFAAQKAWRSAAALRDDALGLTPGTTEIQKGTKLAGAAGCPSATTR
jgi:pre-peptidase